MSRTLEDSRRWMRQGTELFVDHLGSLSDTDLDGASGLPGWRRRMLISHVAANADAIGNLVHWAATGDETPMYATPGERAAGLERGSRLSAVELCAWVASSAGRLDDAMDGLTDGQWAHLVVTAQGRTVAAGETAWMRSREVMVHAVDLATGTEFVDLPDDFLAALQADVIVKRGEVPESVGSLAEVTAWLAGRRFADVYSPTGGPVPALEPWL